MKANTYVYKTINWVSKELAHRDNDAGGKENHHCDSAVKPEHKIVNPYLTQNIAYVEEEEEIHLYFIAHFIVEVGVMLDGVEG